MSNDNLLEQAKAIHEKYASRDESIDEVCQAHLAADLLPELIAEVERLRSENNRINKLREAEINQAGAAERVYLEAMMVKDARIKELEADRIAFRNLGSRIEDLETYIERLEAAFLKAEKANLMHHMDADYADEMTREALEKIRSGKDED